MTWTYQKPLNLYLYLPPQSSHPPGTLKSLVYSNLRRFWLQCTHKSHYKYLSKKFFKQLLLRGHNKTSIYKIFEDSAIKLDKRLMTNKRQSIQKTKSIYNKKTMFYHTTYHPNHINRSSIRKVFNKTCAKLPFTTNLIIAYHRPRNIRDALIPTKLKHIEGLNPSNLYAPHFSDTSLSVFSQT